MEKLFIDYVGPFPRSKAGYSFALVAVNAFSEFTRIFPMRMATCAASIACLNPSLPPGAQFISREFQHFVCGLGIHNFTTTVCYPNQSHAEWFNWNLKSALVAFHHANHSLWDSELHWLQFTINLVHRESVKCAPISVMFDFTPNNLLSNV
jgi:hypothetical protein